MQNKTWKIEQDVDDYMYRYLENLGLPKNDFENGFGTESEISNFMKEALKGGAKTNSKANFGKPDITIEKYIHDLKLPIVIENKLSPTKFIKSKADGTISDTNSAIKDYAINGAIHYARTILRNKKAQHAIAIGVCGNNQNQLQIGIYYVFAPQGEPKDMLKQHAEYKTLTFLRDFNSMRTFLDDAVLTDEEKHRVLLRNQVELEKKAKKLNKLMNDFNISNEQRVIYVSGMLLAMQEVLDYDSDQHIDDGLVPSDLKGIQTSNKRDGKIILAQIQEFLDAHKIMTHSRKQMMLDSFKSSIVMDPDRDKLTDVDKLVAKYIDSNQASITKQIFVYLYEEIYKAINENSGALDIMGSCYAAFLKYALSDNSMGRVLTPPYITDLMVKALGINRFDRVMDLATGSGAFLVSSMKAMLDDAKKHFVGNNKQLQQTLDDVRHKQLLGVEIDAKMYVLAISNILLRDRRDGVTVKKADTFKTPESLYADFKATKLLLNPPFSYKENGMPFLAFGLKHMQKHGKAAIIIQDSAGSGKAVNTNREILANNRMLASIKMPTDLFEPNAGVQTSIYIFEAGVPHDFKRDIVKFIDFRNDGQKRTKRGIRELDHSAERYSDLVMLLSAGKTAQKSPDFHQSLWDLDKQYTEDFISDRGDDWNFEAHYQVDTTPTEADFLQVVGDWLDFQISSVIKEGVKQNGENS